MYNGVHLLIIPTSYFGQNLVNAVQSGQVSEARIDVCPYKLDVERRLTTCSGSRHAYTGCLVGFYHFEQLEDY